MNYKSLVWIIVFSCSLISACTEEFDLELKGEPKLVIEMQITNTPPPYHIQLTKSKLNFRSFSPEHFWGGKETWEKRDYEMVCDARVIVSDGDVIDTLTLCPDSVWRYNEYVEHYEWYYYGFQGRNGFYQTTKIEGIPGHTYHLRVEWQDKVYTAECTMPKAVEIDSITCFRAADKFKDGIDGGYIPYLWFHDDPATANYYLFECYGIGRAWKMSAMSDERLNSEDICGIDAFAGEAPDGFNRNTIVTGGTNTSKEWGYDKVSLYSVTKEIYDYYNSLINQIRYDGGVHTPSPASAPTNIKGGALGVFNAASVDWRYFY
ncbi:MAG: DUF4249 domain-containing protein [Salinivirgaceae bacterium]|nr:DUF4249 domain-containing protein [Salinivirgaceae bacterium]